jgi:hypothetical protein
MQAKNEFHAILIATLDDAKKVAAHQAAFGSQTAWTAALKSVKDIQAQIARYEAAMRVSHVKASFGGLISHNAAN